MISIYTTCIRNTIVSKFNVFERCVAIKIAVYFAKALCPFSANSSSQLDILRHNGDTFSVDST